MLMMFPFEAPTIFEGIHKSYFRMPRVVKDQKNKFENDDLFRQLSHESAVKYTGFKDRPLEERQMKFVANCQEGHTEVSVVQSGIQFTLMFNPTANPAYNNEGCDFNKELGKVHIKAGFILNGVCVLWRGWVDLQRLEGFGCLEFDEYRAYLEDAMLKQQLDKQCNNNTAASRLSNSNNTSPLGGPLSNHHHLQQQQQQQQPPLTPQHPQQHLAAAAAAAIGLNPACLSGPPNPITSSQQQQQIPQQAAAAAQAPHAPVTLADTSSYYGNAAIAAAAAAAFHQAFGVGANGIPSAAAAQAPHPPSSNHSHHLHNNHHNQLNHHNHHQQAVRNLQQRFSNPGGGGLATAMAAGGCPTMQSAPGKVELQ